MTSGFFLFGFRTSLLYVSDNQFCICLQKSHFNGKLSILLDLSLLFAQTFVFSNPSPPPPDFLFRTDYRSGGNLHAESRRHLSNAPSLARKQKLHSNLTQNLFKILQK